MRSKIALAMMLKNERDHIAKTFISVQDYIDTFIILDTGSTDGTQQAVEDWCTEHKKKLFCKETVFEDFSETRNILLKFAEQSAAEEWLLLLDASDEIQGNWNHLVPPEQCLLNGFLVTQKWYTGDSDTIYKNLRLIRNRCGWRYKGVVHEYLYNTRESIVDTCPNDVWIFQDRTLDGNKSFERFKKDYSVLLKAIEDEPSNERYMYYLGQTCECIGYNEQAIIFYTQYLEFNSSFEEEVFQAKFRIAANFLKLGCKKIAIQKFLDAFESSGRIEPLIEIGATYLGERKFRQAYLFLRRACSITPSSDYILFCDSIQASYRRWHLLGIAAFYVGKLEEGKNAVHKAIDNSPSQKERELNESNLLYYLQS